MKKKILMQIRDGKTLAVDTLFPIALIILGMYLATIVLLKSGVPRDMQPTAIYPDPIELFYNTNSSQMNTTDSMALIKSFHDRMIAKNTSAYKSAGPLEIPTVFYNTTKPNAEGTNFVDQIGLKEHLSPTRANGLVSMIKQIKMYAIALQAK